MARVLLMPSEQGAEMKQRHRTKKIMQRQHPFNVAVSRRHMPLVLRLKALIERLKHESI